MHKRRATGGKKKAWRKKRKYVFCPILSLTLSFFNSMFFNVVACIIISVFCEVILVLFHYPKLIEDYYFLFFFLFAVCLIIGRSVFIWFHCIVIASKVLLCVTMLFFSVITLLLDTLKFIANRD